MVNRITQLRGILDAEKATAQAFRYKLQKGLPGMTRDQVNRQNKRASEALLVYEKALREQNAALARQLQAQFNRGAEVANHAAFRENVVPLPNAVVNALRNNVRNENNAANMRRAKEVAIYVAEKLVLSKRALVGAARAAARGSVVLAKKLGEKAERLAREALERAPDRQVVKEYARNLMQKAKGIFSATRNTIIQRGRNILARYARSQIPENGNQAYQQVNLTNSANGLTNAQKKYVAKKIKNDLAMYKRSKTNAERRGNVQVAATYGNLIVRYTGKLRKVEQLPVNVAAPRVRANNTKNNKNYTPENVDLITQNTLSNAPYIIIKVGSGPVGRLSQNSLVELLKSSQNITISKNKLRNWLHVMRKNFPTEPLFKHPLNRTNVTAKNIYYSKNTGGETARSNNNANLNNSKLIKQLVNVRIANLDGNSTGILAMLERLDQRIPEFQVCTILSRQAKKLPIYKRDINTRVLVLLRLILYRERITQALKNFIAREWPRGWTMQKNMNLRAIAQNIQGIGARSGVGLNLPRANEYNMGGTGMCHFEEIPFTNRGRKSREDRIDDIRKLFHGTCNRFLELRNAAPNKNTWELNTTRSFGVLASGGGPCVDNAVNALLTAISGAGANNFRLMR